MQTTEEIKLKNAALAVLLDAVLACPDEDVRTPSVFVAIDYLGAEPTVKAEADTFRKALDTGIRWTRFNEARDAFKAIQAALERLP